MCTTTSTGSVGSSTGCHYNSAGINGSCIPALWGTGTALVDTSTVGAACGLRLFLIISPSFVFAMIVFFLVMGSRACGTRAWGGGGCPFHKGHRLHSTEAAISTITTRTCQPRAGPSIGPVCASSRYRHYRNDSLLYIQYWLLYTIVQVGNWHYRGTSRTAVVCVLSYRIISYHII